LFSLVFLCETCGFIISTVKARPVGYASVIAEIGGGKIKSTGPLSNGILVVVVGGGIENIDNENDVVVSRVVARQTRNDVMTYYHHDIIIVIIWYAYDTHRTSTSTHRLRYYCWIPRARSSCRNINGEHASFSSRQTHTHGIKKTT